MLEFTCEQCKKKFQRSLSDYTSARNKGCKNIFCSGNCCNEWQRRYRIDLTCTLCRKAFQRTKSEIAKSKNVFCSLSCAARYNNTHKARGIRRSKLEIWLEKELSLLYPQLEILYNNREAIGSELDLYIPDLALAFELNGIFHYKPIFGEEKLERIQINDSQKSQASLEQGIELHVIDISSLKHFEEQEAGRFLNIITSAIV